VTRIKFLNRMGQRASQPNGRSPTSQGRVRLANVPGTCTATARGTLAFHQLSARLARLGEDGLAICCTLSRFDPVELTEHFTSRFSAVKSQLRKDGGVSSMNAQRTRGAPIGLTFDIRSLSSGCDSEINTESQGDLSCRRNKRTRLPRSVRLPYENRSGDRSW
jgi:hypothetical protein